MIFLHLLKDPNLENGRLDGHEVLGDESKRLLAIDEVLPHVALEAHALEYEAAGGQEALVVVDGGDDEPADGAEHGHNGERDEQQRRQMEQADVALAQAVYLQRGDDEHDAAVHVNEREIDARNRQLVPVVDEEVELDPLLRVVGERRELLEYDPHAAHGDEHKRAEEDQRNVDRVGQVGDDHARPLGAYEAHRFAMYTFFAGS